jgi:hypothetical protein
MEVRTTRFQQIEEVPETPPPTNGNDEPEIIERATTSFYTLAELKSDGIT